MTSRQMALTLELVARCHRIIADTGPEPGLLYLDEADYAQAVDMVIAQRPDDGPVWLFAYGSLIWKPELDHVEERVATAHGWHRTFALKMTRWRGTQQQPGLMMGIDRGGQCKAMVYRLPEQDLRGQIDRLIRREMTAKPSTYMPRWLKVQTSGGPLSALAFVINRQGRTYAGPLSDAAVAQVLASACGHLGSGAEYLYNAVANLEMRGIHDTHLWALQKLVAQAIDAQAAAPSS